MKGETLYELFLYELQEIYSAEIQILESLPNFIKLVSYADLKEGLTKHLKETQQQVKRIEKIYALLDLPVLEKQCKSMEWILKEGEKFVENRAKSATLDAAIICTAQKVEHFEMASYGTLRSFAKYLDMKDEIVNLIQESLNEEGSADKTLTKIAEGTMFSSGVNKEAAATALAGTSKKK